MTTPLGTAAAAANLLIALTVTPAPTVSQFPLGEQQARPIQRGTARSLISPDTRPTTKLSTIVANDESYGGADRLTTPHEMIIGEIRQWNLLGANWDGEGAASPNAQSMKEAVSFVRLLGDNISLPEPMLLASGHAALYWNDGNLFADIEFLGDGRIAYFIKKDGDRNKGVISFDSTKMPAVFPVLIGA